MRKNSETVSLKSLPWKRVMVKSNSEDKNLGKASLILTHLDSFVNTFYYFLFKIALACIFDIWKTTTSNGKSKGCLKNLKI